MHEGHPFIRPSREDDDVHIFVRWRLRLPRNTHVLQIIESIKYAFDLVWHRADSILENSDSVLILGKDHGAALDKLKTIASKLEELGYYTYIIKEQPDRLGESIVQKVLRYALSSKFVLIENTEVSGHLYEIPHVTKAAECVTVVLQEERKGATWMFEDAYAKHKHWHKLIYRRGQLERAVEDAVAWAEKFVSDFADYQVMNLPWLQKLEGPLEKTPNYESGGREFESLRARQIAHKTQAFAAMGQPVCLDVQFYVRIMSAKSACEARRCAFRSEAAKNAPTATLARPRRKFQSTDVLIPRRPWRDRDAIAGIAGPAEAQQRVRVAVPPSGRSGTDHRPVEKRRDSLRHSGTESMGRSSMALTRITRGGGLGSADEPCWGEGERHICILDREMPGLRIDLVGTSVSQMAKIR